MANKQAIEEISVILSQLLRNNLAPKDDALVLQAQEISLDALYN